MALPLGDFAHAYVPWTLRRPVEPELADAKSVLEEALAGRVLPARVRDNVLAVVFGLLQCARFAEDLQVPPVRRATRCLVQGDTGLMSGRQLGVVAGGCGHDGGAPDGEDQDGEPCHQSRATRDHASHVHGGLLSLDAARRG
jgi:hypothetical protein